MEQNQASLKTANHSKINQIEHPRSEPILFGSIVAQMDLMGNKGGGDGKKRASRVAGGCINGTATVLSLVNS